jgi:cytochrome b561
MKTRTVLLLWLDCSMLLLVILLACLSLTGLQLHEWLGFLLCPLVLLHVVMQWRWFLTQFQRVLKPGARRFRINASLNLLLLVVMAAVLVSGALVSNQSIEFIGERFGQLRVWNEIHGLLNFTLVVLVGLHLALNWDWMSAALRRLRPVPPGVWGAALHEVSAPSARGAPAFMRWFGRAAVVLAVTIIAAGGTYFAMERMITRPEKQEATTNISSAPQKFIPQGRPASLSNGIGELGFTAGILAFVVIIGRVVLRLRL